MPTKPRTSPKATEPTRVGTDLSGHLAQAVGDIERALVEAVEQAPWITPADAGAVSLALKLARDVDRTTADDAAQLASLARTLLATLASIGLTVTGRVQADTPPAPQENPLDALRARAAGRLTDAQSVDPETVRPIKRR
jgi:hypothetical protein